MKSTNVKPLRFLTAIVLGWPFIATTAPLATDESFSVIVSASMTGSDVRPCTDYASYYSYAGTPYYVRTPETGKISTRHEGIDFCMPSGAEVIAAANGTVVHIDKDNSYRGGRVAIRTKIEYRDNITSNTLHLDTVHITPKDDLRIGDAVKAGQVIGYVQPPGKVEIGEKSHVHFSAGPAYATWDTHTDPNRFWQKGPGNVSCFNPRNPPTDFQVVAPIKC